MTAGQGCGTAENLEPKTAVYSLRSDRNFLVQLLDDALAGFTALAIRMAEATAAYAVLNIKDEIVAGAGSHAHGHGVESERVASSPRDHVVRAGGIAADAESSDEFTFLAVEGQASAKNYYAADRFTDHRIVLHSELLRIAKIGDVWIRRSVESVE